MKDNEKIETVEHKFYVLPEAVHEIEINKIELNEFKSEKTQHKELIVEESENDKKINKESNEILDSLFAKLIKLGLTEKELVYLGIESPAIRQKKAKSNNGKSKI